MSAIIIKQEHTPLSSLWTIFHDGLGFLYELTLVDGSYSIRTVNVDESGNVSKVNSTIEDNDLVMLINLTRAGKPKAVKLIKETRTVYYSVLE